MYYLNTYVINYIQHKNRNINSNYFDTIAVHKFIVIYLTYYLKSIIKLRIYV